MEKSDQLNSSIVEWVNDCQTIHQFKKIIYIQTNENNLGINKLQAHDIHKEKLIHNILELKDGVILAQIFNYSVPKNYRVDESQMYTDDIDNWAFTLKNLNILYDSISFYNQEICSKPTPEIEFLSIFNEDNKAAMLQLVNLKQNTIKYKQSLPKILNLENTLKGEFFVEEVFAIVLQNETKNDFITAIMDLDEVDQERLSHFIKKLLKGSLSMDKIRLDTDQSMDDNGLYFNPERKSSQHKEPMKQISNEKDLLRKIDELEFEQSKERKKYQLLQSDYGTLELKLNSFQDQLDKKDMVIDKLIKQRDEFFNEYGCHSYEELQQEIKNKQNKISDLNKVIDELKNDTEDKIRNLRDEINLHEKKAEKYKNYDKMVETVKTLNEENKYVEKRVQECEKIIEDLKKRNSELSQKATDKDEMMKKKFEQKQLVQKNVELETELGTKTAECQQLQTDVIELQQLNQKQEEQINSLNKKINELQMKSSEKKKPSTPTRRNLSTDMQQLDIRSSYKKSQKHKSETMFPTIDTEYNADDDDNKGKEQITEQDENLNTEIQSPLSVETEKKINGESHDKGIEENYEFLQIENTQLRSQIKKMQQDTAKKSSISDQYKQIYQLQEDNAKLESQVAILKKKCNQTSGNEDDNSKTIKNLQETIKSYKERVGLLQEENKELKESTQSSDSVDKLKSDLQKCKSQMNYNKQESEDKKKMLEEEIKLLTCVVAEIRMKVHDQNATKQTTETLRNNSQLLINSELNRQTSQNSSKSSPLKKQ